MRWSIITIIIIILNDFRSRLSTRACNSQSASKWFVFTQTVRKFGVNPVIRILCVHYYKRRIEPFATADTVFHSLAFVRRPSCLSVSWTRTHTHLHAHGLSDKRLIRRPPQAVECFAKIKRNTWNNRIWGRIVCNVQRYDAWGPYVVAIRVDSIIRPQKHNDWTYDSF